jgi:hypothetical protein
MVKGKGKVLEELPPKGNRVKHLYDWDAHVKTARDNVGRVVLAETSVPVTHINSLRLYRLPPFVTTEGFIKVSYRNSKVQASGVRTADVYLQWEPTTKETK